MSRVLMGEGFGNVRGLPEVRVHLVERFWVQIYDADGEVVQVPLKQQEVTLVVSLLCGPTEDDGKWTNYVLH